MFLPKGLDEANRLEMAGEISVYEKVSGMDEAVRRLSSLSQPSWPLVLWFLGHAYVHGYPPFISRSVQTSEKAIKERLVVPSTDQRIGVDESGRTLTFDEFFIDPMRAVSEATRTAMIQVARVPPVHARLRNRT